MKRKRPPPVVSDSATPDPETVVPEVLLEQAKRSIEMDRFKKPKGCVVCGGECAPTSTEGLCWVCRRLKLSAWRDTDTQIPVQE